MAHGAEGDGRCPRLGRARFRARPSARRDHRRRRYGRDCGPPHPSGGSPGHPDLERRRDAADGRVGSDELGGFHRALGARR